MNSTAPNLAMSPHMIANPDLSLWLVAIFCFFALGATFWSMKGGFGPQNLRAVGIVFIASLVAILSLVRSSDLTTAMGIFGAIAGYLFGSQRTPTEEAKGASSLNIQDSSFGDGAKFAGRDINETLNRISGDIDQIKDSVIHVNTAELKSADYLFTSQYDIDGEPIEQVAQSMKALGDEGWEPFLVYPSYDKRGLISIFRRKSDTERSEGTVGAIFHGNVSTPLLDS